MLFSKKNIFVLLWIITLLLLLYVFMKCCVLFPAFYKNNSNLDKEENDQIKTLLLDAMAEAHSKVRKIQCDDIFTQEYQLEFRQLSDSQKDKSVFVVINANFMDNVVKNGENEYTAEVQLKWPNSWKYFFRIERINERFLISYLEIDP